MIKPICKLCAFLNFKKKMKINKINQKKGRKTQSCAESETNIFFLAYVLRVFEATLKINLTGLLLFYALNVCIVCIFITLNKTKQKSLSNSLKY